MSDRTDNPGATGDDAEWAALARYLDGGSPPGEAERVRRWLEEEPGRARLVGALDRLAVDAVPDVDVEGALAAVHARMEAPRLRLVPGEVPARRSPPARPASPWSRVALRVAAALVLALGAGLLMRAVSGGGNPEVASAEPALYATAVGERDSVRLPDGSLVLLGPLSELVVAAGYGEGARVVELRGEALFEVTHDDARPFSVRAGAAEIRDLGTVFTVRSDGAEVRVVVTEGSVRLSAADGAAGAAVVLRPGDRGVLAAGGAPAAERGAATDDDLGWTRGRLVFRETPLAEVSAEMRRWYGVELRLEGEALARRELTASFEGEPVGRVLEVIALATGARVEMRGDTAVLRER